MPEPLAQILLHKRCRACGEALEEILNLGTLRLNAFPATPYEIPTIPQVPLLLTTCTGCGLVQLDRTVPPDWMYRTYWYRSGVNESMVAELRDVVEEATRVVPVGARDRVLDIGANDGTLLAQYSNLLEDCPIRVAVDPALNLQARQRAHCEEQICGYFPVPLQGEPYAIITAIACSYDLEDPTAFFQAIHDQLAPGGGAIIQFQDLGQQITSAAFDNIVHEHLEYYTTWAIAGIARRTGLTLQRVATRAINGGSLRILLRRQEDQIPAEASVGFQLTAEAAQGLDTPTLRAGDRRAFTAFRTRVERVKVQIAAAVQQAVDTGWPIDVYGASTKGNVLLQVLGLGPEQVRQAIDRSPEKVGLHTITGIPIVSEATGRADPAPVWLSPIWQFRESLLRREAWYLEQGGTIIFPLPQVEILRGSWR